MKVKSGKITKFPFKEREYHQKPNNANDMNDLKRKNMLGYYLADLIEGDGSIIVPKTHRNEKGKLLYPFYWFSIIDTITPGRGYSSASFRDYRKKDIKPTITPWLCNRAYRWRGFIFGINT